MSRRFEVVVCPKCGSVRTVTRHTTSHLLHFFLTLVTCGLWLPIWLMLATLNSMREPERICPACRDSVWKRRDRMWNILTR